MRAYEIKAERGREVTLETPDFLEQARQLLSRSLPVELRMSGSSMRPAIEDGENEAAEAVSLYEKLEHSVAPMYANPHAWSRMQQHCIAINGTFFNTHRMLAQYFENSYFPPTQVGMPQGSPLEHRRSTDVQVPEPALV